MIPQNTTECLRDLFPPGTDQARHSIQGRALMRRGGRWCVALMLCNPDVNLKLVFTAAVTELQSE